MFDIPRKLDTSRNERASDVDPWHPVCPGIVRGANFWEKAELRALADGLGASQVWE